ncbi:MAG: anti-sigma F factor [Lachnospiraceae bacterium]|nr:anti-sigma F factor [Lachnospiraceae bacterium]
MENEVKLELLAIPENEGFARVAVAAFITPLNPTMEEISDVKTAVSEAVTNAVIHAYDEAGGMITIRCSLEGDLLHIEIEDRGKGIENVKRAMEPLFTTRPDLERSGMGFAFMEAFMDSLEVESVPGQGTCVIMEKKLGNLPWVKCAGTVCSWAGSEE